MLVFVFLVATLNLGVGYALGAKLTLADVLAMIPRRKKGEEDLADEEPLTAAAEEPAAKTEKPAEAAPAASKPEPEPEPATKSAPTDVMASLSLFRAQLAEASADLQESQENPDQFVENASKLQKANHAYLEEAGSAIQQLNELGEAGDESAAATCSAVTRGAEKVAELSGEIDGMIDQGLDSDEARSGLLEKAKATNQAAEACQAEVDQVGSADAQAPTRKPVEGLATVDELFQKLEAVLGEAGEENSHHVAAIRVDPIAGQEDNEELTSQVEERLLQLAQDALDAEHTLASGTPTMALLAGDDFDAAIGRMESIRKQIESTTFSTPSGEVNATVTCALADARSDANREMVLEQINLALDESNRSGGNRTYHHDGAFPTPVGENAESVEAG